MAPFGVGSKCPYGAEGGTKFVVLVVVVVPALSNSHYTYVLHPFDLEGSDRLVILNENKKIYLILYLLPYLRLHSVLVKSSSFNS